MNLNRNRFIALMAVCVISAGHFGCGPQSRPAPASGAKANAQKIDSRAPEAIDATDVFADRLYNVEGRLPPGWVTKSIARGSPNETTIRFSIVDRTSAIPSLYYQKLEKKLTISESGVERMLMDHASGKVQQRVRSGLFDYKNGAVLLKKIRGASAVEWTAEFTRDGEAWAEFLTSVYSPNMITLFFVMAPAKELPDIVPQFEKLIGSVSFP